MIVSGELWVDPERGIAGWGEHRLRLSAQEVAMLAALVEAKGRVIPREELARRAGLGGSSPRRCDGVLVGLRRALGEGAVQNVRRRGWQLLPSAPAPTVAHLAAGPAALP
jgi:DNA-binding response OmpR family regulator